MVSKEVPIINRNSLRYGSVITNPLRPRRLRTLRIQNRTLRLWTVKRITRLFNFVKEHWAQKAGGLGSQGHY